MRVLLQYSLFYSLKSDEVFKLLLIDIKTVFFVAAKNAIQTFFISTHAPQLKIMHINYTYVSFTVNVLYSKHCNWTRAKYMNLLFDRISPFQNHQMNNVAYVQQSPISPAHRTYTNNHIVSFFIALYAMMIHSSIALYKRMRKRSNIYPL